MVIIRILNNNVVKAKDRGQEMIVSGKGIAFGKKAGEKMTLTDEHKVYYLSESKEFAFVKSIVDVIPGEYWDFATQVVNHAEQKLEKKLDSNMYFSLVDHFYTAVKRRQEGMILNGFFSTEIKLYFKDLYDLAVEIVKMAEEAFSITFDEGEIYFVATHLLDASLGTTDTISLELAAGVIDCAVNKVKEHFSEVIDVESTSYSRFITHLKLFASRVIASNKKEIGFFEKKRFHKMFCALMEEFPKQYECLNQIIEEIRHKFKYEISNDEQFYLMLHIVKITDAE